MTLSLEMVTISQRIGMNPTVAASFEPNVNYKNIAPGKSVWMPKSRSREKHHPGLGGMAWHIWQSLCNVCLDLDSSRLDRFTELQHTSTIPQSLWLSTTSFPLNPGHHVMLGSSKCKTQAASPANLCAYLDLCLSGLDTFPKMLWLYCNPILGKPDSVGKKRQSCYHLACSVHIFSNLFQEKGFVSVLEPERVFSRGAWVILTPHISWLA